MANGRSYSRRARREWIIKHCALDSPPREDFEKWIIKKSVLDDPLAEKVEEETLETIYVIDAKLLSKDFPWIDKNSCRLNGYRKNRMRVGSFLNHPLYVDFPYPKTRPKKPGKANNAEISISESPAHTESPTHHRPAY